MDKQFEFLLESDKEKFIQRKTLKSDGETFENDAEHAWHMAIMCLLLEEYANEDIDLLKTISMILIHDVVEIDAGDTYAYDEEGLKTQREREEKAVDRIFALLPADQRDELRALFEEFEAYETPEAKYAHAMDNLQPLLLNASNEGDDWKTHGVSFNTVWGRQQKTACGSEALAAFSRAVMEDFADRGILKDDRDEKHER